nr:MAG TPA: hypothetical protein [Caudoviricetes sp.]
MYLECRQGFRHEPHLEKAPEGVGYFDLGFGLPRPISSHACFLLLSGRGLGQAKTQIEVFERMRNGQKEDQNSSNSRGS